MRLARYAIGAGIIKGRHEADGGGMPHSLAGPAGACLPANLGAVGQADGMGEDARSAPEHCFDEPPRRRHRARRDAVLAGRGGHDRP